MAKTCRPSSVRCRLELPRSRGLVSSAHGGSAMSIQDLKSVRRRQEELVGRYMQEIRDIAKGGFNRRELLKMGLVLGGAGLIELAGMRGFEPYWAHADNAIPFISPPNTPFVDPLPIPPTMRPVTLNPAPTKARNPHPAARPGPGSGGPGARCVREATAAR